MAAGAALRFRTSVRLHPGPESGSPTPRGRCSGCAFRECGPWTSQTEAKKRIVQAIDVVAKRLGNTRAVCRACYVHPTVLDAYLDCSLCTLSFPTDMSNMRVEAPGLHPEEAMILALLKQRSPQPVLLSQKAS